MKSPNALFLRTFALGFVLVCAAFPACAQWKWKDANGKIQYSDLAPPPGTPDANILQRPAGSQLGVMVLKDGKPVNVAAPAPSAQASAPSKAELDAQAKLKQDQADQLARQKAEQARVDTQKRENCAAARNQLATLQSGVRLRTGADGAIMDDEQRAAAMDRAQRLIASECR